MKPNQQYILARDTIDMIRDHTDNENVLEYLDSFCFSIARILEGESVVEWDEIAAICDHRYYSLMTGSANPTPIDIDRLKTLYTKYEARISNSN